METKTIHLKMGQLAVVVKGGHKGESFPLSCDQLATVLEDSPVMLVRLPNGIEVFLPRPMETIELIQGMDEAIRILKNARLGCLAGGSLAIWCMVDHAETHLDKQIRELMAPPVEVVANHTKDSDCTLDPQTYECIYCRVWHGGPPCSDCGQHGYHRDLCRQLRLRGQLYAL